MMNIFNKLSQCATSKLFAIFSAAILVCSSSILLADEASKTASSNENYNVSLDGWVPLKDLSKKSLMHNFKINSDGSLQFLIDTDTKKQSGQNELYGYHIDGLIEYRALCPVLKIEEPNIKQTIDKNKDLVILNASPHTKHSITSSRCFATVNPL